MCFLFLRADVLRIRYEKIRFTEYLFFFFLFLGTTRADSVEFRAPKWVAEHRAKSRARNACATESWRRYEYGNRYDLHVFNSESTDLQFEMVTRHAISKKREENL